VSLVLQDVVDEIRDLSPVFDKSRTTDRVLVRHLSTYQQRLVGDVALANPDLLSRVLATFTQPLQVWPVQITLPPHIFLRAGTVSFGGEPPDAPVILTTFEQRFRFPPGYALYETGNTTAVLAGDLDSVWQNVTTLTVWGVALPDPLVQTEGAMAQTLDARLPDHVQGAFVAAGAALCAFRAATHPTTPAAARPDAAFFRQNAQAAHDAAIRTMAMMRVFKRMSPADRT